MAELRYLRNRRTRSRNLARDEANSIQQILDEDEDIPIRQGRQYTAMLQTLHDTFKTRHQALVEVLLPQADAYENLGEELEQVAEETDTIDEHVLRVLNTLVARFPPAAPNPEVAPVPEADIVNPVDPDPEADIVNPVVAPVPEAVANPDINPEVHGVPHPGPPNVQQVAANPVPAVPNVLPNPAVVPNNIQPPQDVRLPAGAADPYPLVLRKDQISPFHGDPNSWHIFWDEFKHFYHNNPNVPVSSKFRGLRYHLKGPANDLISGLAYLDVNYPVAIQLLKDEYGDINVMKERYHRDISLLCATSCSVSEFPTRFKSMRTMLLTLGSLGEDTNQSVYTSALRRLLPSSVRLQMDYAHNGEWTTQELMEAIRKYLLTVRADNGPDSTSTLAYSTGQSLISTSRPFNRRNPRNFYNQSNQASNSRFSKPIANRPSSSSMASRPPPRCIFCHNTHFPDKCPTYTTSHARIQRLNSFRDPTCRRCLKPNHNDRNCNSRNSCYYCKDSRHHFALCFTQFGSRPSRQISHVATEDYSASNTHPDASHSADTHPVSIVSIVERQDSLLAATGERVILRTALITVKNPQTSSFITIRCLFDTGSHGSYITERLALKLKLFLGACRSLRLGTFGCKTFQSLSVPTAQIQLMYTDGVSDNFSVCVVPQISQPIERFPVPNSLIQSVGSNIKLADSLPVQREECQIDLLIGQDFFDDLILTERIQIRPHLYLTNSKFGFILSGRYWDSNIPSTQTSLLNVSSQAAEIEDPVPHDSFQEDDFFQSSPPEDDKFVWQHFLETHKIIEGRYFIRFPFKIDPSILPSNYDSALRRLRGVLRKLQSEPPEVFQQYVDTMSLQLSRGIIEPVDVSLPTKNITHYIAHRHVYDPERATTKLRVVYDASARADSNSMSLNDCLYKGPIILENLCGLLIRFRFPTFPVISDVEKAFLQVGIQDSDRDTLRFLWLKNPNLPCSTDNIQVFRFARLPFGPVTSPSILGMVIQHHLKSIGTPLASQLADNTYVDNVFHGANSIFDCLKYYPNAKEMFAAASMNLREFASNCKPIMESLPDCDRASGPVTKILGLKWNFEDDTLSIKSPKTPIIDSGPVTKRQVMKSIASVFDPLGMFAPVKLSASLFLQSLWRHQLQWDQSLPEDLLQKWYAIASELKKIPDTSFPRHYSGVFASDVSHQLHVFCDASISTYSAVVYLRVASQSNVNVTQLFAKYHLAPKGSSTIPRLELRSIVLACKLVTFVETEIRANISAKFLWSDSQCALSWLISKNKLPQFVQNRVSRIQDYKDISFRHISGVDNPAELAMLCRRQNTPL